MTFFLYIKIVIFGILDILDILDSDLTAFRLAFTFNSPCFSRISEVEFPHIRNWVPANFTLRLQFAFDSCSWLMFLLFRYACWPGSDLRFSAVDLAVGLGLAVLGYWEAGLVDAGFWWFAKVPEPDERWSVLIEMRCFIYILIFQIKSAMEMKWYEIWRPRRAL